MVRSVSVAPVLASAASMSATVTGSLSALWVMSSTTPARCSGRAASDRSSGPVRHRTSGRSATAHHVRRRVHAHLGDRVVGPAHEILREQAERQVEQPHEPARRRVPFVLDLHLHEEGVGRVELDGLGQVDDLHRESLAVDNPVAGAAGAIDPAQIARGCTRHFGAAASSIRPRPSSTAPCVARHPSLLVGGAPLIHIPTNYARGLRVGHTCGCGRSLRIVRISQPAQRTRGNDSGVSAVNRPSRRSTSMVQHAFRCAVQGIEHRPGEMAVVDVRLVCRRRSPTPIAAARAHFPTSRTECDAVRIDDECLGKMVGGIRIGQKDRVTRHDRQPAGNNVQEKETAKISCAAGRLSIRSTTSSNLLPVFGSTTVRSDCRSAQATMEPGSGCGERDILCRGSVGTLACALI